MYDFIIIGAGYGGLTAASLLAKSNKKVLILESHYSIGGCAGFYKREGLLYDVGATTLSGFDYGGPLTEMALLGMIAIRLKNQKLEWDSKNFKFINNEAANALLHKTYRKGWSL